MRATKLMRDLGFVLLGLAIGIAIRAGLAGDTYLEAGIGYAKGTTAPDGIWWESQFPTDNRVSGRTFSIGVAHVFDNRLGLRADYTDLLHFTTNNVAIPDEFSAHAVRAGALSCADSPNYCLSKWHGHGRAYGVHLGVFYDLRLAGWHIQPEVGALPFSYTFAMDLDPLEAGAFGGRINFADGGTFLTGYARLTLLRDWMWLRFDYNRNIKGATGIQQGRLFAVLAGIAWKFR